MNEREKLGKEPRFVVLDSLRGIAAVTVFAFHCMLTSPHIEKSILRLGVTGVDLFFIISGFVIVLTIERKNDWESFVINRFTKLFPAYWIAVSITALLILVKSNSEKIHHLLTNYLGNLSMVQRYLNIPNLDEQYWTLEVEIIFYLFILIVFLFKKLKSIELIGLFFLVFCAAYDILLESYIPISRYFILINHFPLFYAGIIFFKIKKEGANYFRYATLLLSFLTACILFNNGGRSMYYISLNEYIPTLMVYYIVFLLAISNHIKFIEQRALLFMGRISYSFYLVHQYISSQIIIPGLQNILNIDFYLSMVFAFLISCCLAALITFYIEEPSVRLGKEYLRKNRI